MNPGIDPKWRKMAKRLLLDPDGRNALKEYGLDVEVVGQEKTDDKPVVAILCPTYRAPEPKMRDALTAMARHTGEAGVAVVYSGAPVAASIVHWSRNWLITEQLKSGKPFTHVLFIDDDITPPQDALVKMLAHKKDIVAGLCTRRTDPPVPNIRFWDETQGYEQIWDWPQDKDLIEVGGVGTGLMLISKNALEQVAQAYFDCLWEQDMWGLSGDRLKEEQQRRLKHFDETKIAYWFRFLESDKVPIEYGEDISFCHMARKYCGIPVYVDVTVQPGHIGNYEYSIADFIPHQQECIARSKAQGKFKIDGLDAMTISILVPTRRRPQNIVRLLDSIAMTAAFRPEVVLYVDDDDKETLALKEKYGNSVKFVVGPRICLSECWNKCYEAATGDILMHAGDDIVFKTKDWDEQVIRAFTSYKDKLIFVHGDDGVWGDRFGTHGFLHRRWAEEMGYFCPPYFSSDYNDTWFNEVFNALRRRIYLPFVTEHMHPIAGKAHWDATHQERLARHQADNVKEKYESLAPERARQIEKLRGILGTEYVPKAVHPDPASPEPERVPGPADAPVAAAAN